MTEEVIEDTSGFYKLDPGGEILFGPNFVFNAEYNLTRESKDSFTYPVDGWSWFDSAEQAYTTLGIV